MKNQVPIKPNNQATYPAVPCCPNPSARGAILVLVAIALVIFIGLVGLVVDSGIISATRHQMNSAAQVAALGAMAEYLKVLQEPNQNPDVSIFQVATGKATERAELLLQENQPVGRSFLKTPSLGIYDLTHVLTSSQQDNSVNGIIQIGEYYAVKPTNTTPPQNIESCSDKFPCFTDSIEDYKGNAIKITLKIADDNQLQTQFMRLLGIKSIAPKVTAFASLIPRNDAFLLDLSGSVVADNYANSGITVDGAILPLPGSTSFMVYPVPIGASSTTDVYFSCTSINNCPVNFTTEPPLPKFGNHLGIWGNDYGERFMGTNSPLCESASAGTTCIDIAALDAPFIHYRDQYRGRTNINFGKNITSPGSPPSGDYIPTLLIDYNNNNVENNQFLAKPQPLMSMLQSLGTAMKVISDRSVSADRMNLTGFDRDIFKNRTTCADKNCADRFVAPTDSKFTDLKLVLEGLQDSGSTSDEFITKNALFPLPIWTDLFMVVLDAIVQFEKRENVSYAKNSIFLFTDGVATCGLAPSNTGSFIANTLGDFGNLNAILSNWVDRRECVTNLDFFNSALYWLASSDFSYGPKGNLVGYLKSYRISVSVVLFGNGVRPHYLARKTNVPNKEGCLTMEDAVISTEPDSEFVNSDITWDPDSNGVNSVDITEQFDKMRFSDPDAEFFLPNILYDLLVKPTKGAWIPVMPPLGPLKADGSGVSFDQQLEDLCKGLPNAGDILLNGLDIVKDDGVQVVDVQVVDDYGRVLYDPKGRSVRVQIEEAMAKVLTNPYVLVAPIGGAIN